jgi:hypothetical protein
MLREFDFGGRGGLRKKFIKFWFSWVKVARIFNDNRMQS